MPRVTRTDQAEDDIAEIDFYLSRFSTARADRVLDGIDRTCRRLARFPRLGQSRAELRPDLMSYPTRDRYIIYYIPFDNGIEVQRVLHGARQVDPSMFEG